MTLEAGKEFDSLVISRLYDNEDNPPSFTQMASTLPHLILGVDVSEWTIVKGKEQERTFSITFLNQDTDEEETRVAILERMDYTIPDEGWLPTDFSEELVYYDMDGGIGAVKDITREKGVGKLGSFQKRLMAKVIERLQEDGEKLDQASNLVDEPIKTIYKNVAKYTIDLLDYYFDTIYKTCIPHKSWSAWIEQMETEPEGTEIYTKIHYIYDPINTVKIKDLILEQIQ